MPRVRTLLCGATMLAVTAPFTSAGLSLWNLASGAADPETLRRLALAGVHDLQASRLVLQGSALVLLGACAWTAVVGLGVAARRPWARWAGLLTFLLFALISLPPGIVGLLGDPRPAGAGQALVVGLVNGAVLWLLASQGLADDVARADFYRRRRRTSPPRSGSEGGPHGGSVDPPVLAA